MPADDRSGSAGPLSAPSMRHGDGGFVSFAVSAMRVHRASIGDCFGRAGRELIVASRHAVGTAGCHGEVFARCLFIPCVRSAGEHSITSLRSWLFVAVYLIDH